MNQAPRIRHAARVLLLDEDQRLLLFRAERPETGEVFWFPPGGGLEEGEDARAAAVREVGEETGLADFSLGPEIWRRRHFFTWRGQEWDQRERWFMARVAHFEPSRDAMSESEQAELTDCRWWTLEELRAATDELAPRELATLLGSLLAEGAPPAPIDVGA